MYYTSNTDTKYCIVYRMGFYHIVGTRLFSYYVITAIPGEIERE